jgi:hypothetical protein
MPPPPPAISMYRHPQSLERFPFLLPRVVSSKCRYMVLNAKCRVSRPPLRVQRHLVKEPIKYSARLWHAKCGVSRATAIRATDRPLITVKCPLLQFLVPWRVCSSKQCRRRGALRWRRRQARIQAAICRI